MDYTTTSARMFEDPDLNGNLLLLAQGALHELYQRKEQGRPAKIASVWERTTALIGTPGTHAQSYWLRSTLAQDVPRYEMDWLQSRRCMGTMLRPAGAPCKKGYTLSGSIPDPVTGERTHTGACSNPRHRAEFELLAKTAWDAWRAAGSPAPANNRGGVLPRYFDTNWDELYKWASYGSYDADRTEVPAPKPPRARLRLVPPLAD